MMLLSDLVYQIIKNIIMFHC